MKSRTYRFTEKDPVCGECMTMVDDAGFRGKQHVNTLATLATKAPATIYGILYGDTKKPRNDTVMSLATALGYKRTWVRDAEGWDFNRELAAARAWIKKQRAEMEESKPKKKKPAARKRVAKGRPKLRLVA